MTEAEAAPSGAPAAEAGGEGATADAEAEEQGEAAEEQGEEAVKPAAPRPMKLSQQSKAGGSKAPLGKTASAVAYHKYDVQGAATWKEGSPVPYLFLAQVFGRIEQVRAPCPAPLPPDRNATGQPRAAG